MLGPRTPCPLVSAPGQAGGMLGADPRAPRRRGHGDCRLPERTAPRAVRSPCPRRVRAPSGRRRPSTCMGNPAGWSVHQPPSQGRSYPDVLGLATRVTSPSPAASCLNADRGPVLGTGRRPLRTVLPRRVACASLMPVDHRSGGRAVPYQQRPDPQHPADGGGAGRSGRRRRWTSCAGRASEPDGCVFRRPGTRRTSSWRVLRLPCPSTAGPAPAATRCSGRCRSPG